MLQYQICQLNKIKKIKILLFILIVDSLEVFSSFVESLENIIFKAIIHFSRKKKDTF
jgi:hypothetical protein